MINVEGITQEHLTDSIQWISKMSDPERWSLTDAEVASLLGGTVETYHEMLHKVKCGLPIELTLESIQRLSLLLGIWKDLQLLVPDGREDLAIAWFNTPNSSSLLNGSTIKNYLLENDTLEGFYTMRNYLNLKL